jgi:acetamidase/formamidase
MMGAGGNGGGYQKFIVDVAAGEQICMCTAGTTGSSTIQIYNETNAADVLSTPITVLSAATTGAGVGDGAEAEVTTGDILRVDIDSVSTTEPKGLLVNIEFSS